MDAMTGVARAIACASLMLAGAAPAADPTDAAAAVPGAPYRSAFSAYKPDADTATAPWRDTNQRVRQRGGWRAYAREAAASDAAQAPTPASAPPPAPAAAASTAPHDHSGPLPAVRRP